MSQEIRFIFFLPLIYPQMKFLWVLSISFWILEGIAIYCMIWVCILLRVDLSKVILPAMLRNLVFHPSQFDVQSIKDELEITGLGGSVENGKAKIIPKFFLSIDVEVGCKSGPILHWAFTGKENFSFWMIDSLSRVIAKAIHDGIDGRSIFWISLSKECEVISKEKLWNLRPWFTDRNGSPI